MNYRKEIDRCCEEYEVILLKPDNKISIEDRNAIAERIIRDTFSIENRDIDTIYKKVVLLNSLYSTQIYDTFSVALKIYKIDNFHTRVSEGDLTLIDEIRDNVIHGKRKDFYSFATKYCHHHNPKCFPIYDTIVVEMLISNLSKFDVNVDKSKLRQYLYFKSMIDKLAEVWDLSDDYKYNKLDKYLWNTGKNILNSK